MPLWLLVFCAHKAYQDFIAPNPYAMIGGPASKLTFLIKYFYVLYVLVTGTIVCIRATVFQYCLSGISGDAMHIGIRAILPDKSQQGHAGQQLQQPKKVFTSLQLDRQSTRLNSSNQCASRM